MLEEFSYPITFLPCKSLELVRPFYEKTLKLKVALEQKRCILFKIRESYWGFCDHYNEQIKNPESVCLTLVVDTAGKVDSWHSWMQKQMVPCKKTPAYNTNFKIYHAFYVDPTGYTIEIQAFDADAKPR